MVESEKGNQYLLSRVDTLVLSNETLECKVQVLETLVTEKKFKLKEVSLEFERTQKSLKMLNSCTSKLYSSKDLTHKILQHQCHM